jgi:hypothetical protein
MSAGIVLESFKRAGIFRDARKTLLKESMSEGGGRNLGPGVELEPARTVPDPPKEKQPGIMGHHPCPCGSGKKYRDCCRTKLS